MSGGAKDKRKRMGPYNVLIVEDQPEIAAYCRRYLSEGFAYEQINSGQAVEGALKAREYDLVLLDKNFTHCKPEELLGSPSRAADEGIEILKKIKTIDINMPVIMITGFGDSESVSAAFRLGAFDYAEAEIMTKDEMILRRKMENAILGFSARSRELLEKYNRAGLIGSSKSMLEVFRQVENTLKTDCNILLLGDTGVGKDAIAKAIHSLSDRSGDPFIRCDMTQTELLESNLFGHLKGAFTDARSDRKGFFELADGGIILLNEIGELPAELQAKLLVALEDREFYPKGSERPVSFEARIIAATNKDLERALAEGSFRRDLYSRLNQVKILIPPLSKRKEDIPLLARHFVDYYCQKNNLPSLEITDKALEMLRERPWPGNVRELKHTVEQLVNMADGVIQIKEVLELDRHKHETTAVDDTSSRPAEGCFEGKSLLDIERDMMAYYLRKHNGYVKPACEAMKVSKAKFYSRVSQYDLKHLVRGYSPQNHK